MRQWSRDGATVGGWSEVATIGLLMVSAVAAVLLTASAWYYYDRQKRVWRARVEGKSFAMVFS